MGFFSKKPSSAPASIPAAAPQANAAPPSAPIAITGLGLACHAGGQPYELISSIVGQVGGVQLSDEYQFKSGKGTDVVPRMATVEAFGDMADRERMRQLAATALADAATQLSADVKPESVLIVISVNPELITRYKKIDAQHLQNHLAESIPRLSAATYRILPVNTASSTAALRAAIAELNEGKWQAVIFGGADSLISIFTCQDLHEAGRLNAAGKSAGIVPGEGAAFVVLQSKDAAAKNTTPALGYLLGLGVAPEPHARDADIEATDGLSTAINQAITQAGITATDIQGIVQGLGAETVHAFEWYQTTQKIWPRRVDEQQRVAVQLGEIEQADIPDDPVPKIILPHLTMGEVGAAALPMRLATALAWVEFDAHQARWGLPTRKHLLVCDTPEAPERGAIVIGSASGPCLNRATRTLVNDNSIALHTESATDLYDLRQSWLEETDIQSGTFEGLEERLGANLHHCARALRMNEPANDSQKQENASEQPEKVPSQEPDCFVFLAAHINSPDPATSAAGYNLAYQWLGQDAAKSAAAEAVLSLYPEADPAQLHKCYDEQEALRPAIFRIYRKQMQPLPIAKVNTAASDVQSTLALKLEALRYAAAQPDIGLDMFRNHYLPLLTGKTQFDADIVEAAIWGGMVRGDLDAQRAISIAISNTSVAKARHRFVRLAALSGAAEFLPLLQQVAESAPDTGYPLLALYGQKSVMPDLLKALETADTMEQAATAYTQITDRILPRIPRLTVAGKEEEEEEGEDEAPKIPDIKAARDWWSKHQSRWKTEERWLFGKPATPAHLAAMGKKHAGSFGNDVMALLALAQKKPLNIPPEIWRARQQQLLAVQVNAKSTAKLTTQPVKARHA